MLKGSDTPEPGHFASSSDSRNAAGWDVLTGALAIRNAMGEAGTGPCVDVQYYDGKVIENTDLQRKIAALTEHIHRERAPWPQREVADLKQGRVMALWTMSRPPPGAFVAFAGPMTTNISPLALTGL